MAGMHEGGGIMRMDTLTRYKSFTLLFKDNDSDLEPIDITIEPEVFNYGYDSNVPLKAFVERIKMGEITRDTLESCFDELVASNSTMYSALAAAKDDLMLRYHALIPQVADIREQLYEKLAVIIMTDQSINTKEEVWESPYVSRVIRKYMENTKDQKIVIGDGDIQYVDELWRQWADRAEETLVIVKHNIQEVKAANSDEELQGIVRNTLKQTVKEPLNICLREEQYRDLKDFVKSELKDVVMDEDVVLAYTIRTFQEISDSVEFTHRKNEIIDTILIDGKRIYIESLIRAWNFYYETRRGRYSYLTNMISERLREDGNAEMDLNDILADPINGHPLDLYLTANQVVEIKHLTEGGGSDNDGMMEVFYELLAEIRNKSKDKNDIATFVDEYEVPRLLQEELYFAYFLRELDVEESSEAASVTKDLVLAIRKVVVSTKNLASLAPNDLLNSTTITNDPRADKVINAVQQLGQSTGQGSSATQRMVAILQPLQAFYTVIVNIPYLGPIVGLGKLILKLKNAVKTGKVCKKFYDALEEAESEDGPHKALLSEMIAYGLRKTMRKFFSLIHDIIVLIADVVIGFLTLCLSAAPPVAIALLVVEAVMKLTKGIKDLALLAKGAIKRILGTQGEGRRDAANSLIGLAHGGNMVAASLIFDLDAHIDPNGSNDASIFSGIIIRDARHLYRELSRHVTVGNEFVPLVENLMQSMRSK